MVPLCAGKRGEMGVGTLIVFIAMLLVAAVAAGVLIQTSSSLQEKSLSTGQQAKSQISTNVRVYEVSGTDATNGNLTDFHQIIKVSPGSDPIKFRDVMFTFATKDATTTLEYRGKGCKCIKNNEDGYNTWETQKLRAFRDNLGLSFSFLNPPGIEIGPAPIDTELDLDGDGINDTMQVCDNDGPCPAAYDGTHFMFNLSEDGLKYVHLVDENGEVDLSNSNSEFNFSSLDIKDYATIKMWRGPNSGDENYYIKSIDGGVFFEIKKKPLVLEEDYNDDNIDDTFGVNRTHAIFEISGEDNFSVPFGKDICTQTGPLSVEEEISNTQGDKFATVQIDAALQGDCKIPEKAITIIPYHNNRGYFAAIYETEGTNHVEGNLQRGDVVRLCYEAPGEITEDQLVRLNFIPKIGTPTPTRFVTPDVMSTHRVYLYP